MYQHLILPFTSWLVYPLYFLLGLTTTMLYFIYRYNKKKNKTATKIEGNTFLEIIWTTIPTLLALLMFYFGWAGWKPMYKAPDNAMIITSTARMWNFSFQYENGKQSTDLVVPVNTPVKIKLVSPRCDSQPFHSCIQDKDRYGPRTGKK